MDLSLSSLCVDVYAQQYPSKAPSQMKYSEIIKDFLRYMRQKNLKAYPWGFVHKELCIRAQPPDPF